MLVGGSFEGDGTGHRVEDAAGAPFTGSSLPTANTYTALVVVEAISGADFGLTAWGSGSQFWLDNNGGALRIGHQLNSGVSYSASPTTTPTTGVWIVAVSTSPVSGTETWWHVVPAGSGSYVAPSQAFTNAGYFVTGTGDLTAAPGAASSKETSTGATAMFALWDRAMTGAELEALVSDPFGPIRPAGTLILPEAVVETGPEFPDAPPNLTATVVSDTQIDLSWDAVGSAIGYRIERDGSVIVPEQVGLTYSDTGLSSGTTYTYNVRAIKGGA
jgi:hypothetical protein